MRTKTRYRNDEIDDTWKNQIFMRKTKALEFWQEKNYDYLLLLLGIEIGRESIDKNNTLTGYQCFDGDSQTELVTWKMSKW